MGEEVEERDRLTDEQLAEVRAILRAEVSGDVGAWAEAVGARKLNRFLFERCAHCHKGFTWGYSPISNWSGDGRWHHECYGGGVRVADGPSNAQSMEDKNG